MTMKKGKKVCCVTQNVSFWRNLFSSYYYTWKKNKALKQDRSQSFWNLYSSATKMKLWSTGINTPSATLPSSKTYKAYFHQRDVVMSSEFLAN